MRLALDQKRQQNIRDMINYVIKNNIEGDILDIGVYEGGSTVIALQELIKTNTTDRDFFIYDTFEGMPEPTIEDGEHIKAKYDTFGPGNWVKGPLEMVQKNVAKTNYPNENITFVKGLVEDTLSGHKHEKIAYMRLDTDFYSSTKVELEELYPYVSEGGVIIIDDYYSKFVGQTKAVNDFFVENGLDLGILKKAGSTAYFIKQ